MSIPRAIGTGDEQDRESLRRVELRAAPRPSRLELPITSLKGAGPKLAAAAAAIGIETLADLLWHCRTATATAPGCARWPTCGSARRRR